MTVPDVSAGNGVASKALVPLANETTSIVAVGSVHTLAPAEMAELKKVITHTRQVGVVLPPPDIRAIIDKTAQFVGKNGMEFEKRILANEKNNVKFNFLVPTDPYHGYYKMRIKDFSEEGKDGGKEVSATEAAVAASMASLTAPSVVAVAPVKPLEKPPDEMYTVHVPEGMSYQDLDIIKLTAQFVARNGKSFLVGLSTREHSNPQFNFLKPTHSLFSFFTSLCDAYSRVMMPDKGLKERLNKDAADSAAILERSLRRLEYEKAREAEAREAEDERERERLVMQAIDWHDFTICETIDFADGGDDELPPPLTLKDIIALNKSRDYALEEEEAAAAAAADSAARGEANGNGALPSGAGPMDEQERALVAEAAAATAAGADDSAAPTAAGGLTAAPDTGPDDYATAAAAAAAAAAVADDDDDVAMDEGDQDEDDGPVRVVKNYVRPDPRAAGRAGFDPTKLVVSPITGELIPISEMAEHMRISLIDPRWREQKEAMLSKIRDSTAAGDDEITRNLVGLARTRPDIFGSTREEVTQAVTSSIQEKATSGAGRPVVWDGATAGGPELKAQVRAIADSRQQLAGQNAANNPPIPAAPHLGPARHNPPLPGPPGGGGGGGGFQRPGGQMQMGQQMQMGMQHNASQQQQQQQQQQQMFNQMNQGNQPPLSGPPGGMPPPPPLPGIGGGVLGGMDGGLPLPPPPPGMNKGLGVAAMMAMTGGNVRAPLTLAQQQQMLMQAQGGGGMRPPAGMMGMGGPMGPMGGMGGPMAGMNLMQQQQMMQQMMMQQQQQQGQNQQQGFGGGGGQHRPPLSGGGGGGGNAPPPPREAPPPMPEDEPEAKRIRSDFVLEAEEEFKARFPGPSRVKVVVPEVEGSDKMIGQLLEVEVATLEDSVGDFKQRLAGVLDLPANKQNLSREGVGFLKNELSLAHYNVSPDIVLTLGVRERGGRKK